MPPRGNARCSRHLVRGRAGPCRRARRLRRRACACWTPRNRRQSWRSPGTWCRPVVTDGDEFQIRAGRHPVVEAALAGHAAFVPNHCDLSPERRVLLLTGPNMAGKSTYLRQNALIVVLAQAWPAGAGGIRAHRRGGPAVQPGRRLRRPGARPLHLHGRDDRDRGDPAPGRAALPGRGRRDRPRHRHAGRPRHRLGGAGSAALGHPLPHHFRHTFS